MRSATQPDSASASSERGVTLVEVMAVLVILGVMMAVGVPTFQGARSRSQDAAAQQALYDGFVAASVVYVDELDFEEADASSLVQAEPQRSFVASPAPSTAEGELSIAITSTHIEWGGAVRSDTGTCFYLRTNGTGATAYGSSGSLPCTGDLALTVTGSGWTGPVAVTGLEDGFQSDPDIGGYWNTHFAGSLIGGEWEVVSGSVDAHKNHDPRFDYGVDGQFIDLNGNSPGHIRRTVAVAANTDYVLTFDLGENTYGSPDIKQMEVIWNGEVIATLDVDVPDLELQQISLPIPAGDSTSGVLEFTSTLGTAYGPILGNPQLTPA